MGIFKRKLTQEEKDFDAKFDKQIKDIFVLTEDDMGAGKSGKEELWTVSIRTLAYIDLTTQELVERKSILQWLVTERECRTSKKKLGLAKETIYQLKVRESLPYINPYNQKEMEKGKWLKVEEVVKRKCHEPRLDEILKEYQKDVVIHPDGCGELKLDKSLGLFSGSGIFNQQECLIHLDKDEESETANNALHSLKVLLDDSCQWDLKAKQYAAQSLTDLANDWADEEGDDEISEEDFIKRISISEVCVSLDGDFELFYDDGDLFYGHVIIVSGNIESGFEDADIAG